MPAQRKDQLRTRRQQQASQAYQDAKARRKCCDAVWAREGVDGPTYGWWAYCHDCSRVVLRSSSYYRDVGHVHERRARSLGGDPTDAAGCVLLCHACHFDGPSGAHRRSVRATV